MRRMLLLSALLFATTAMTTVAHADQFIDQSQTTSDAGGSGYVTSNSTLGNAPLVDFGQTFTPTLGGIDFFSFYVRNDSNTAITLNLNLYDATVSPTTSIGSATAIVAANAPAGYVEFDFASTVALTPGDVIAAALATNTLPSTNALYFFGTDVASTYTGGSGFENSTPLPYQSQFIEGVLVPEPSAICLSAIGLIGMAGGAWARRRRKLAA